MVIGIQHHQETASPASMLDDAATPTTAIAAATIRPAKGKVKLRDVNPHLVCVLCHGYFVDATSIAECLHSFCRSCIILYLETKSYCPICEVQINKTKPHLSLKPDKTLQDIVYKLVPGLFHSEMKRRNQFYMKYPQRDMHLHPECRGVSVDRLVYSPQDTICISLEYYDRIREKQEWEIIAANPSACNSENPIIKKEKYGEKKYITAPAEMRVACLKKLIIQKYSLDSNQVVELFYRRESLLEDYSLMDIAYIYTWKRSSPMRLYYRIHRIISKIVPLPLEMSSSRTTEKNEIKEIDEENESNPKSSCEIAISNQTTNTSRSYLYITSSITSDKPITSPNVTNEPEKSLTNGTMKKCDADGVENEKMQCNPIISSNKSDILTDKPIIVPGKPVSKNDKPATKDEKPDLETKETDKSVVATVKNNVDIDKPVLVPVTIHDKPVDVQSETTLPNNNFQSRSYLSMSSILAGNTNKTISVTSSSNSNVTIRPLSSSKMGISNTTPTIVSSKPITSIPRRIPGVSPSNRMKHFSTKPTFNGPKVVYSSSSPIGSFCDVPPPRYIAPPRNVVPIINKLVGISHMRPPKKLKMSPPTSEAVSSCSLPTTCNVSTPSATFVATSKPATPLNTSSTSCSVVKVSDYQNPSASTTVSSSGTSVTAPTISVSSPGQITSFTLSKLTTSTSTTTSTMVNESPISKDNGISTMKQSNSPNDDTFPLLRKLINGPHEEKGKGVNGQLKNSAGLSEYKDMKKTEGSSAKDFGILLTRVDESLVKKSTPSNVYPDVSITVNNSQMEKRDHLNGFADEYRNFLRNSYATPKPAKPERKIVNKKTTPKTFRGLLTDRMSVSTSSPSGLSSSNVTPVRTSPMNKSEFITNTVTPMIKMTCNGDQSKAPTKRKSSSPVKKEIRNQNMPKLIEINSAPYKLMTQKAPIVKKTTSPNITKDPLDLSPSSRSPTHTSPPSPNKKPKLSPVPRLLIPSRFYSRQMVEAANGNNISRVQQISPSTSVGESTPTTTMKDIESWFVRNAIQRGALATSHSSPLHHLEALGSNQGQRNQYQSVKLLTFNPLKPTSNK